MPRGKKRETRSGEDAQDVGSVPGQRYGEGVEQQQLQAALPAPDRTGVPAAAPAAAPTTAPPAAPPGPEQLAEMLQGAPIGLLSGGTGLPDEPITSGLSSGPGAGPEALGTPRSVTPLGATLRELHARTGNQLFRDLAERARL